MLEPHATADEVLMAVTFDVVLTVRWAGRARHGWDSQLGRLALRLAPRAAQNACGADEEPRRGPYCGAPTPTPVPLRI